MSDETDITRGPSDVPSGDEPTRALGVDPPVAVPEPAAMPTRIGRYAITRVLGEGGMGTVYEAQQENPSRTVALKVVRAGHLSEEMLRRFVLESQVLGRLQHPGIAQVHEAGMAQDEHGRSVPFFAMEYVRGVPLDAHVEAARLGTRDRLELVARICDAVYHAHQKGVIHRDLKPANILVDEAGQPRILDFGVARATDADVQTATLRTDVGQLIGTVPYMSPEQVSGDPGDLDTRSDVYALGVIAYELLAGRLPYHLEDRMIHEAVRVIREEEPTRLSSISRMLRGDVETIVAKALEKDKTRRYQSAESLGSDIRRYLHDEPIEARPASTWYQLRKFSRRNRGLVAGAAAALVLLVAGLAGTSVGLVAAQRSAEREAEQRRAAEAARVQAEAAREEAEAAREEEATRAEELRLVADFQAEQLGAIEPDVMGIQLRRSLLDAVPEDRREALGAALSPVNFTTIALTTLEENIFERTIEAIDRQFEGQPLVQAQLLQTASDTLQEIGLLDLAADPQERALAIRLEHLGDEHPASLRSRNRMGVLLSRQGRLSEAEPQLRATLEARRRVLGDDHRNTLVSIGNVGAALNDLGRLSEAEPYYREALEGRRRVLGDQDPSTLGALGSLGVLLIDLGRPAEAEAALREAIEGQRRVLGDEHPDTLASIANLAVALEGQGRSSEAEPHHVEALEGRRRRLGDGHPETLGSMQGLGGMLRDQGRLDEAEPYLREVLEIRRRVLGDEHPDTLNSMNSLGMLLQDQGRLAEAERSFRAALRGSRDRLGDDHPRTIVTMNNLALLLRRQGRASEAGPLLREVLEGRRLVLGDDHPDTLGSANSLAVVLFAQGRLEEAEPYFREALDGLRRTRGDDHPDTLGTMSNLAVLLRRLGKSSEAESSYREVLAARRRVLGDEHPDTILTLARLGSLLHAEGRSAEAEVHQREVLAARRRVHGDEHPDTLAAVSGMGTLVRAQGRAAEAETYYREALAGYRTVLGDEHVTTLRVLGDLALTLELLGRREEAVPYLRESLQGLRRDPGDEHPSTLIVLGNLARLSADLGRGDEALALADEAVDTGRRVLGEESELVGSFLGARGRALHVLDRHAEAVEAMRAGHAILVAAVGDEHRLTRRVRTYLVEVHEDWHAAEPEAGHDAAAERWRAQLPPDRDEGGA